MGHPRTGCWGASPLLGWEERLKWTLQAEGKEELDGVRYDRWWPWGPGAAHGGRLLRPLGVLTRRWGWLSRETYVPTAQSADSLGAAGDVQSRRHPQRLAVPPGFRTPEGGGQREEDAAPL